MTLELLEQYLIHDKAAQGRSEGFIKGLRPFLYGTLAPCKEAFLKAEASIVCVSSSPRSTKSSQLSRVPATQRDANGG